jgi:hypothetical protein
LRLGSQATRLASVLVMAGLSLPSCVDTRSNLVDTLPPVRTPLGVHLACQPPQPLLPLNLCSDVLEHCPFAPTPCGASDTILAQIDAEGRVVAAFVAERRSASLDACVLARVRGWTFEPARECNGDPLAGQFENQCAVICDPLM